MRYYRYNNLIGMVLIFLGSLAIVIGIAPLLFPLLMLLGGLFLVHVGLRFCGRAPIIFKLHEIWRHYTWHY